MKNIAIGKMLREERQEKILNLLDEKARVYVNKLAVYFQVTMETIRRDLDYLEKYGKLKKVHGGAIKVAYKDYEPIFIERVKKNYEEKKVIGRLASKFIKDNEIIGIDLGTTTLQIINHLSDKKNLTIVTHSIPVLNTLVQMKEKYNFDVKVIFVGGEFDIDLMFSKGSMALKHLGKFYFDKVFVACGGISLEKGITDNNIEGVEMTKQYIYNAKEAFVLADYSKINVKNFYKVCELRNITGIISNKKYPDNWKIKICKEKIIWTYL